jgi:hypothetical protein
LPPSKAVGQIVRLLDKTTRVIQTMAMRADVLSFSQRQLERRILRLETALARSRSRKRSTTSGSIKRSRHD